MIRPLLLAMLMLLLGSNNASYQNEAVALDIGIAGEVPEINQISSSVEKIFTEYGFKARTSQDPAMKVHINTLILRIKDSVLKSGDHLTVVFMLLQDQKTTLAYCVDVAVSDEVHLRQTQMILSSVCAQSTADKAYNMLISKEMS